MTRPADPARPAAPSAREIADLTARLREITARGRGVDPAKRAQFLADKDALIARITHTDTAAGEIGHVDAIEEEFDELCERHPLPGDGPGEWVTTRTGTFWADYGEVNDYTPPGPEIAIANPDIWDPEPDGRAQRGEPEQERREQLVRWNVDDQAAAHDHTDSHGGYGDALGRYDNGPTPQGGTP